MKIIVTGATGLIGSEICKKLLKRNYEVIVFTRNVESAKRKLPEVNSFIEWDYKNPEKWEKQINGKDVVIHLAGANIFGKRWNENYKKKILESRILSTKNLVNAIKKAFVKPSVFISSSAVGYYGDCGNEILTEENPAGKDFLSSVCSAWEDEAAKVEESGIRGVSIRTGIVLSAEGGALKKMLLPFKFFIGGPIGNGKQWFPWIHIDDLINIYLYALDNSGIKGAVNASSTNPVTMNGFAKILGKVLRRPSIFPVPKSILKIVSGEAAEYIVMSQRVSVDKILNSGYRFRFEKLEDALRDLLL